MVKYFFLCAREKRRKEKEFLFFWHFFYKFCTKKFRSVIIQEKGRKREKIEFICFVFFCLLEPSIKLLGKSASLDEVYIILSARHLCVTLFFWMIKKEK